MTESFFKRYSFAAILLFIFSFAWYLQSQILINVDVSWLLEATKRMLAGGTYTKDYFENNPPWILYFYIPPVIFEKVFSSIVLAMRSYVFLLSFVSLSLSYYFFKQIFAKQDIVLARLLTVIFAILFLIFPMGDFGQRDHLFLILSMPYFLMMVLRLQDHKINPKFAMLIGLLAGSVFLIKPYFLVSLFIVEFYYLIKRKNIFVCFRPETVSILVLLILYAGILFFRHPDYLHIVLPHALRWCYLGTRKPWIIVVYNQWANYCYLPILFYIATYEVNRYKQFSFVMLLVFVGFMASYLLQQEDWPYHLKPAFSMAIILNVICLYFYINTPNKNKYVSILMSAYVLLLLSLFNPNSDFLNNNVIAHPFVYFGLIASVFIFVLCQIVQKYKTLNWFAVLLLSLWIGYLFNYYTVKSFHSGHYFFSITSVFLIITFACFIKGDLKNKLFNSFITALGLLIFLLPYYITYSDYCSFKNQLVAFEGLKKYLNQNAAGNSVYFFVTNPAVFPTIKGSNNVTSASRFSFFWSLPGMIKQSYFPMDEKIKKILNKDKNYLIDMISEDLITKKPKYVFVDALDKKASLYFINLKQKNISYIPFDYISYFKSSADFNKAWASYHYVTTLTGYTNQFSYPLYKFSVYQRN